MKERIMRNKTGLSQLKKWTLGSKTGLSWLKSGYLEMELDFGSKKMDIGSGSKYSQMKKWKIENIQFMQNMFREMGVISLTYV